MSRISPAILVTSMLATGACAFTAGLLMAPQDTRVIDNRPIVDPYAWEQQVPQAAPANVSLTAAKPHEATSGCSRWDVSEEAMEATLTEMQRKGWRPPDDVESAISDTALATSYEPDETHDTSRASGSSLIAVVSDAESKRMWRIAPEKPEPEIRPTSTTAEPAEPAIVVTSN